MKIRKLVALFLCLAMICSFFVACGSAEKAPKTEAPAEQSAAQSGADAVEEAVGKLDGTGLKIGLSQQHLTNDFNRGILAGATAMAKELGAELITANDEKLIECVSHHFTLLFCQKHHNIIASLNKCCHLFRA